MKEKLLMPVTDWATVPEGSTLWRDGVAYNFKATITKGDDWPVDTVFCTEIKSSREYWFTIKSTFLIEVEPVVMFVGEKVPNIIGGGIAIVDEPHKESYFATSRSPLFEENPPYTVIVLNSNGGQNV